MGNETVEARRRRRGSRPSGRVEAPSASPGETLTFGNDMFTWEELYAAAGQYVVGFLAADMDGNITPAYTQVEVR